MYIYIFCCTRSPLIKRLALNLLGSGGHGFAGATGHVRRAPCAAGTEKDWNVNLWRFQHHDSPLILPWFISQVMPNPSVLPNWFAFTNRRKIIGRTEYVYSSIFMYIPCWYHLLMFSSYPFAPICCFSMFLVAFHAIPGASRHLAGWRSSQRTSALTQFSWNLLFQERRRLCEKIVTCLQLRFKMVWMPHGRAVLSFLLTDMLWFWQ